MRRSSRPALLALLIVFSAASLSACTSSDPESPRVPGAETESSFSGRSEITPLITPMRMELTRWARGNVPRTVPEADTPLPSLLDDPPGRALVASYVPRPTIGISGEAIELYGVDGRWRRLVLGDLGLPANDWNGVDTYGAGALSPDGRWWAGPMIDGMFVVDLRDGSTTTIPRAHGRGGGMASFEWSPDSDELVLIVMGRSTRVSVPSLEQRPFPRPGVYLRILANGGWLECPSDRGIVTHCRTYGPGGVVVEDRSVPEDLRRRWAAPAEEVAGSLFYSLPRGMYGNWRHDWEVLRTAADFQPDARLILPARSEINSVTDAFDAKTLGLAATDDRQLLAWLVDEHEIVRVIRPSVGIEADRGQDWWDISFARDLVRIR
jgi:hypothetical protein